MKAKALPYRWQDLALALGLGLGLVIGAAGAVRAEGTASPAQPAAQQTASAAQVPAGFVCDAQPGSWCDLRDWSGMDHWSNAQLSEMPR